MIVEDQSEVVEFLSRPEAYGEWLSRVDRLDTHISIIFLVARSAFKLKRSVRLPYLDFSTVEQRRRMCEAEVRVNRRTAPDIYRGVVPVLRTSNGRLRLGQLNDPKGGDTVVDWLVAMERFDQSTLFDRLAVDGRLDRFAMEDLADAIARFHSDAQVCPEAGGAGLIDRIITSNAQCFDDPAAAFLDQARVEAVTAGSRKVLSAVADGLERRRRTGRVRHGHGDLHLRNIFLHDGSATLFDAIEFDPDLAKIDVLYDLAFLVMDLDHRGLRRHASILLNRYLDVTGDALGDGDGADGGGAGMRAASGLAAMPLFLAVRAAIRSHVDALASATLTDAKAAEAARDEAGSYLDRALAYLEPDSPRLVAVGGLSGTGKSRMARDMSPHFGAAPGARIVRTDATRKRLAGVELERRLGSAAYGPEMTQKTYAAVFAECRSVLAAGQSVIADAVFSDPGERMAIEEVARGAGVPFFGLWLEAPPDMMEQRVTRRRRNVSDATSWVVKLQMQYDLGDITWSRIDTSGSREDTLSAALVAANIG